VYKKSKLIAYILVILVVLGLFSIREQAVSASVLTRSVTEDNMVFIPIIHNGIQSQFWIEIAGLHQVEEGFPMLIEALKDSGAGGTRVYLNWSVLEPTEPINGEPQYSSGAWIWYDAQLRKIIEAGIELLIVVGTSPDWAADPCGPIHEDRLDEFARFLSDLINRYKNPPYNVKYWELLNEPDKTQFGGRNWHDCWGDHGVEYMNALSFAYPAIKAADPEATILHGGLAYDWFTENGGPFNRYFPDDVMGAGGANYIDALNFHYFPDFHAEWERWNQAPDPTCGNIDDGQGLTYEAGGRDLIAKATHYRNRMMTCFGVDKPLWVTELAESGDPNDDSELTEQARYVIKGNVRGLAAGITNIIWYALITNDQFHQGLLYEDYSPKPAFYAFKTLVKELKGYEYHQNISNGDIEAYIFNDPGSMKKKVVAWGNGRMIFNANLLRIVDRNGKVTEIRDGSTGDLDGQPNNEILYKVSQEPSFIQQY